MLVQKSSVGNRTALGGEPPSIDESNLSWRSGDRNALPLPWDAGFKYPTFGRQEQFCKHSIGAAWWNCFTAFIVELNSPYQLISRIQSEGTL